MDALIDFSCKMSYSSHMHCMLLLPELHVQGTQTCNLQQRKTVPAGLLSVCLDAYIN